MDTHIESARRQYERDGFYFSPPVIPPELIERASRRMDAVMKGEYDTGVPPSWRGWNAGDDEFKIRKINEAHLADKTLYELITHPELGRMAAAVTGAAMVQVWASQMLFKPSGGQQTGNVGWHQDRQYWQFWEGEVFTAWIAISDVTARSGPVRFVRGSHRWKNVGEGNFFGSDLDALRQKMALDSDARWEEAAGILAPGAVSFHHNRTIHGSGPNLESWPRRAMAVHLRTEKSQPAKGAKDFYVSHLDEPDYCPVIYDER